MADKQFVVIGLGRFGKSVATTLSKLGHDVLAIDIDEKQVDQMKQTVTEAVVIENTSEDTFSSLGIGNFDVGIVAIGKDIQANILTALILKELDVGEVVTRAQSSLHGKVLEKIGADRIVYPERDMGTRVAYNLTSLSVLDYIELSPEFSIEEIRANEKMENKTLKDLDLRSRLGVNVIAIKRDEKINISPGANEDLKCNDILIVMGPNEGLNTMKREFA